MKGSSILALRGAARLELHRDWSLHSMRYPTVDHDGTSDPPADSRVDHDRTSQPSS